jgi:glycosyltransferase involved in cell wall biosynthesis
MVKILKENSPKVSIGMPVFNGEAVIRRAIESLLTQSFEDFELIISDNASDDATQDICREYASKDKRVIYSRNDRNVGALANFQKVLQMAKGEMFFWAAHDDWWDCRFVASAVTALDRNPAAAASMGVVHYLKANGDEFMTHAPPYGLDQRDSAERAYTYFRQGITDNLIYAVHRTSVLRSAPFASSTCPEKLIILHVILNGAIIDSKQMEYFNVVSFKTQEEVAATLALERYGDAEEIRVFQGISSLLYERLTLLAFLKVFLAFFFKNNWHKFFAKRFLKKVGLV